MKSPKKLALDEMWDLYLLVGDGTGKELLIEEVSALLDKLSPSKLMRIIQILFDGYEKNPLKIIVLLIQGLKKNNYFLFVDFIKVLSNGRSTIR